ncbi:MobF family relaxase [Pseudonocardia dioxanivorans]|uniref:MobF family relaxase n=1 Tax=Pseudonocardia dioxanivorans TaxID=240495 RepID=UPI000CD3247E|nr:MobF family relaxase [Pseudonocardia dioxanivorans]
MLRITAVSAGAVEYLLRGSGCAEHAHAQERNQAPGQEAEKGAGRTQDAAGYFLSAQEHGEAPGRWYGSGLGMVGMVAGSAATADDVRKIFGELKHPDTDDFLGRAPRQFKDYDARVEAAVAREPDASPERIKEIELAARTDGRKAVAYYDFTFSPVKSVSVYYTALVAAGAHAEAETVLQAHREAVDVALGHLEEHGAYVRAGYHGKTMGGRSVGRYERATGLAVIKFDHSTSRSNEPQLHCHAAVLNRAVTVSDGVIRALDAKGFRPIKEAVAVAYERALEDKLTAGLGVVFANRPDGKAREILGVDSSLVAEASTRRAQVQERATELVEAYVDRHGYEPSPAARKAIMQMATLETRQAKGPGAGPQALRAWGQQRAGRLVAMLEEVEAAAVEVAREGHPDARLMPDQGDRAAILQAAVLDVQSRYATWTLGNLIAAVDRQVLSAPCAPEQRPAYLEDLAREAVRAGNGFGVLVLTAADPVGVPEALQRPEDGRLVYRPHLDEVYTTEAHLETERRIVVGARQLTAPAIRGPELEMLRVELAATTLTEDQRAAVLGVVSSGRAGDVLIGPAGTGKSFTVATLARVWSEHTGGRVLGLATSQRAAQVLNEEGLEAINTFQFLVRFSPDPLGVVREHVRPGDLFVLDEAGMSGTAELARIGALVEAGGGKLLYTGDHHQLGAVGAGGLLELLATDNGAYELDAVRRFSADWEKQASIRLRAGDTSVIGEYEDRGRLRGGTVEQMQDAAVRGYLADTLDGLDSLLIVGTNFEAAELSGVVREQLVALGRVDARVLATGSDKNSIGVDDVIQARRNDYEIEVRGGRGMVVNREVYTVRGVDGRGRLVADTRDGATAYLPRDYVRKHVTLGYAGTIHTAQGRTVDTSHNLLGLQSSREDAYVAMTRGRERNIAYLTTERAPDAHQPERLAIDPVTALANILDNADPARAAELEHRAAVEESQSLAWIGTQWDLVSREWAEYRYSDMLAGLLGDGEQVEAAQREHGWGRLMRTLREAELAGHDVERVVAAAVNARSLDDADSVTDVLRYRVRLLAGQRLPEQQVDAGDWTTLGPPIEGPVGQWLQEMAVVAGDRQHELGQRAAEDLPRWAVEHLGLPPVEPGQRAEWVRRAGIVAAYRELAAVAEEQVSIGVAPSREQEFRRALWQQAYVALGRPADALDLVTASDAELREIQACWQREQTWAPPFVADEMAAAYTVAEGYRQDAALYAAELATLEVDSPVYEATRLDVERAERLALDYTERARQLETVHQARQEWFAATEDARVRDQLAGQELERRGVAEPTLEAAGEPEQLELFGIATDLAQPAAAERAQLVDHQDVVEHQAVEGQGVERQGVEQRPGVEAGAAETVGWWQRWRDRLVSRSQPVEVEVGPTAGEQAGPRTGRAASAERAVDQAVDQAVAVDRERDERALAEPDREDKNQLALFELSDEARVGAQPLRVETETPEHGRADTEVRVSLAEARQQARLAQSIREQREAAEPVRVAERHRQVAEALDADRTRRDQAERDQTIHGPTAERAPEQEHSPAGAQIELTQEQSEDWGLDLD